MRYNQDLVTIIVPVYNVESYLRACVESCVKQLYPHVEIILIDDGSTDNSGVICDELAKLHKNVLTFHKQNGGLSDARNYGIKFANGKYIMFVDSDDIIAEKMISVLLDDIKKNGGDIAVCQFTHFFNAEKINFSISDEKSVLDAESALMEFLYQKRISPSACAKLYRSELLENISFVVGQRFEDNDFMYRIIKKSQKIIVSMSQLYGYRHRKNSITNVSFSERDFDIIDIGKKIIDDVNMRQHQIFEATQAYQCRNALRILMTASESFFKDERYIYCKEFLKNNLQDVMHDSKISNDLKIGLYLYNFGIPVKFLQIIRRIKGRWK